MNAKVFLSRARLLEMKVQSIRMRIRTLGSLACRMTAGFGGERVKTSLNPSVMQDYIIRTTELEETLKPLEEELAAVKMEIALVIDRVRDPEERKLLELRYLEYMTARMTAEKMGYSIRWVNFHQAMVLREVQEILDGEEMVDSG